jgi:hypothetical protein
MPVPVPVKILISIQGAAGIVLELIRPEIAQRD